MSQLENKKSPLELRAELHKMVIADLLGPAGGEGERLTASESARREVLSRLLKLNHEKWEEEEKAGLHEKKSEKAKGRRKAKSNDGQMGVVGELSFWAVKALQRNATWN